MARRNVTDTEEMRVSVELLLKQREPAKFQFRGLKLSFEPVEDDAQPDLVAAVRAAKKRTHLSGDFLAAIIAMEGYTYHYEKFDRNGANYTLHIYERQDEENNP